MSKQVDDTPSIGGIGFCNWSVGSQQQNNASKKNKSSGGKNTCSTALGGNGVEAAPQPVLTQTWTDFHRLYCSSNSNSVPPLTNTTSAATTTATTTSSTLSSSDPDQKKEEKIEEMLSGSSALLPYAQCVRHDDQSVFEVNACQLLLSRRTESGKEEEGSSNYSILSYHQCVQELKKQQAAAKKGDDNSSLCFVHPFRVFTTKVTSSVNSGMRFLTNMKKFIAGLTVCVVPIPKIVESSSEEDESGEGKKQKGGEKKEADLKKKEGGGRAQEQGQEESTSFQAAARAIRLICAIALMQKEEVQSDQSSVTAESNNNSSHKNGEENTSEEFFPPSSDSVSGHSSPYPLRGVIFFLRASKSNPRKAEAEFLQSVVSNAVDEYLDARKEKRSQTGDQQPSSTLKQKILSSMFHIVAGGMEELMKEKLLPILMSKFQERRGASIGGKMTFSTTTISTSVSPSCTGLDFSSPKAQQVSGGSSAGSLPLRLMLISLRKTDKVVIAHVLQGEAHRGVHIVATSDPLKFNGYITTIRAVDRQSRSSWLTTTTFSEEEKKEHRQKEVFPVGSLVELRLSHSTLAREMSRGELLSSTVASVGCHEDWGGVSQKNCVPLTSWMVLCRIPDSIWNSDHHVRRSLSFASEKVSITLFGGFGKSNAYVIGHCVASDKICDVLSSKKTSLTANEGEGEEKTKRKRKVVVEGGCDSSFASRSGGDDSGVVSPGDHLVCLHLEDFSAIHFPTLPAFVTLIICCTDKGAGKTEKEIEQLTVFATVVENMERYKLHQHVCNMLRQPVPPAASINTLRPSNSLTMTTGESCTSSLCEIFEKMESLQSTKDKTSQKKAKEFQEELLLYDDSLLKVPSDDFVSVFERFHAALHSEMMMATGGKSSKKNNEAEAEKVKSSSEILKNVTTATMASTSKLSAAEAIPTTPYSNSYLIRYLTLQEPPLMRLLVHQTTEWMVLPEEVAEELHTSEKTKNQNRGTSSSTTSTNTETLWYWADDNNSWVQFDAGCAAKLNNAEVLKLPQISFHRSEWNYTIDMTRLVQVNEQTSKERVIRKVVLRNTSSASNTSKEAKKLEELLPKVRTPIGDQHLISFFTTLWKYVVCGELMSSAQVSSKDHLSMELQGKTFSFRKLQKTRQNMSMFEQWDGTWKLPLPLNSGSSGSNAIEASSSISRRMSQNNASYIDTLMQFFMAMCDVELYEIQKKLERRGEGGIKVPVVGLEMFEQLFFTKEGGEKQKISSSTSPIPKNEEEVMQINNASTAVEKNATQLFQSLLSTLVVENPIVGLTLPYQTDTFSSARGPRTSRQYAPQENELRIPMEVITRPMTYTAKDILTQHPYHLPLLGLVSRWENTSSIPSLPHWNDIGRGWYGNSADVMGSKRHLFYSNTLCGRIFALRKLKFSENWEFFVNPTRAASIQHNTSTGGSSSRITLRKTAKTISSQQEVTEESSSSCAVEQRKSIRTILRFLHPSFLQLLQTTLLKVPIMVSLDGSVMGRVDPTTSQPDLSDDQERKVSYLLDYLTFIFHLLKKYDIPLDGDTMVSYFLHTNAALGSSSPKAGGFGGTLEWKNRAKGGAFDEGKDQAIMVKKFRLFYSSLFTHPSLFTATRVARVGPVGVPSTFITPPVISYANTHLTPNYVFPCGFTNLTSGGDFSLMVFPPSLSCLLQQSSAVVGRIPGLNTTPTSSSAQTSLQFFVLYRAVFFSNIGKQLGYHLIGYILQFIDHLFVGY